MDYYKLIAIYYYISERYNTELCWHCQRFSNNTNKPDFTDEELLTLYIFCITEEQRFKVKSIYDFAKKHLQSWFPKLPSYKAFDRRLNRLASVFPHLTASLITDADRIGIRLDVSLIDSMPIITCSGKRAGKVAPQLTDKGYCSTKKLHYFGAKLHGMAFHRRGKLPMPEFFKLSKASEHDLTAMHHILVQLIDRKIYADKAYSKKELNEFLQKENGTFIYTPIKLIKGEAENIRQFKHAADKQFSSAVSKVRQPIESLFNWLIEKTEIQRASKVRSRQGLIVHVFGKIAAAISLWVF